MENEFIHQKHLSIRAGHCCQIIVFFIHPNYSSTRGEFKVLISLIGDKYDSDTTNGMVMNCLSESVECSLLAIK